MGYYWVPDEWWATGRAGTQLWVVSDVAKRSVSEHEPYARYTAD